MRPSLALPFISAPAAWTSVSPGWRAALLRLATCWLLLIAAFAFDWRAMALQWWDSSTYNHVLLVPAILGWLVWQRLGDLAKLEPVTWWPGLLGVSAAGFVWLLGAVSGLDLARQAGAVGLLMSAVPVLLGPRVTAGLIFPLAYMVFLVPFGDVLVVPLQMVTAEITIFLVNLSGIPAVIDGVFIETPAGLFEVAEACSGVKFLIAMIAFGVLCANVCFRSWPRRFAMVAACGFVPILANGIRAWGTIFAAQYVGIQKAAGIDHLIYGWVFFALVLALIIAGAWRFFDRPAGASPIDGETLAAAAWPIPFERQRVRPSLALLALPLLVASFVGWAQAATRLVAPVPAGIDLPDVPGWHRVDYAPALWWEPRAEGASHRLLGRYADKEGRTVDVFFALYATQEEGREAGGFGQGALTPDTAWSWQSAGPAFAGFASERLFGSGVSRLALTTYRVGDLATGSNARLKLAVMRDRMALRARPTALLILSSENPLGVASPEPLAAFRSAMGPTGPWMDRIAGLR